MRHLILMGGVAGSGKSTYAKAYAEKHPNTHIIDTDETRKRITGSYHIFTDPVSLIWDAMIADANNYLETHEDCIVIIDSTFLTDERRMYYLNRLKGYDKLTHIMIRFHDYSACYRRNHERAREKWVPENVIKDMIASYVYPSPEVAKRFDEIIEVYADD